jgi:hypothetical protein
MSKWHGGKGDRTRPRSVDSKTFDSNWDRIFKKDKRYEEDGQSKTSKTTKEENKEKRQS